MKHIYLNKPRIAVMTAAFALLSMLIPGYVAAALNGTYTINGSATASLSNYRTFQAAINDLRGVARGDGGPANGIGVTGPVTFNVANGTYTEQIMIPNINGTSATNRITFQSASNDSTQVILTSATGTTLDYTLWLYKTRFITIKGMTISRTGSGTATTTKVIVSDTSSFNQFLNNRIIGGRKPTSSGDFSTNNNVAIHLRGLDSNNLFHNNHIIYGFHGLYIGAASANNTISENIIDSSGGAAIWTYYQTNLLVEKNLIRLAWTGIDLPFVAYAVRLEWPISYRILSNKASITSSGGTARAIVMFNNSTNFSTSGLIANNWVSVTGANTGAATAISIGGGTNLNIYHNNLLVTNSTLSTSSVIHFYPTSQYTASNVNIANNNIIHTGGRYVFDFQDNLPAVNVSNYNNLFTTGSNFAIATGVTGTPFTTFADYKTATGKDANSINVNPNFVSNSNLRPTNTALRNAGTGVGITTDITGRIRPTTTPDIGANQLPFQRDAGISAINVPAGNAVCEGNSPVTVTLRNFGTDVLNSANIAWSVNGVTQTTYNFSGVSLALDSVRRIAIGNFNFTAGTVQLKVWSASPNAGTDQLTTNDTITRTITVNSLPAAMGTRDTTICLGGSAQLGGSSTAGRTYSWTSRPAGFTATTASAIVSPGATTTYFRTERITATGCSMMDSVIVTVNPSPNAMVGMDTTICSGESIMIGDTAIAGNTYSWTSEPAGFTSIDANPLVNPNVTTRYFLTETNPVTGCSRMDSVTITVNPSPIVNLGGPSISICAGDSTLIGMPAIMNHVYSWMSVPAGFTSIESNPMVAPTTNTNYILTVMDTANGCMAMDSIFVTVNAGTTATAGNDTTICAGQMVRLGTVGDPQNTYSWTSSPAGFTSASANPTVNPTVTTTYYLTVTATGPACPGMDSVTITVNPSPMVTAGRDMVICAGTNTMIGDSAVANVTYSWTSLPAGFTSADANPTVNPIVTTTYILNASNVTGCTTIDTVVVTVAPAPSANIIGDSAVCASSISSFRVPSVPGVTLSWTVTGGTIVLGQNSDTLTINWGAAGAGSVKVVARTTAGNCADSATMNVNITSPPVVTWSVAQTDVRTFTFTPSNTGFASYSWDFGDGNTSSDVSPSHVFTRDSTYNVRLTIRTAGGCVVNKDSALSVITSINEHNSPLSAISIFPNPFKEVTTLKYALSTQARVQVSVHDITGREIANLTNATQTPGNYEYQFDANKYNINSGVYFVKIVVGDRLVTRQIVNVK